MLVPNGPSGDRAVDRGDGVVTEQPAVSTEAHKASGSSWVTVIIAFAANIAVAIAKTIAAIMTGSAALVAEAAHSWADAGNEVFLLIAEKRSARPADAKHPLGYGREAYVWSMFAAFGIFTVGAAVSIWHGVQSLFVDEASSDYTVGYIVLAVSAVLEGFSFAQSVRQARRRAATLRQPVLRYVLKGSNPTLRAVFAEDAAALIGLVIAFLAMLLHQLTGIAAFDAIGSIIIGVLLGIVAIVLIDRNRRYLVGENVTPHIRNMILRDLLQDRDIVEVTYLHVEFIGSGKVYVVAAVDLVGDAKESELAVRLRTVERHLEEHPMVQEVVLTPAAPGEKALVPGKE